MAAGFAFSTPTGQMGYYKQPGLGSRMPLRQMPRDARTAIFHTRLATHGPVEQNENNHPVLSPSGRIMLVHNGVIYNHDEVRRFNLENPPTAAVDTSVIPALLDEKGIDGIEYLEGDAAVAWLDAEDPGLLNLARIEHSPMALITLEDGSTVMASTPALLQWALDVAGVEFDPEKIESIDELTYLGYRAGNLEIIEDTPKPRLYHASYGTWSYRGATSGGGYKGAQARGFSAYDGDEDWWDAQVVDLHTARTSQPKDEWELYGVSSVPRVGAKFFTTDYSGQSTYYRSAADLEGQLMEGYSIDLWGDRLFDPYDVGILDANGISPLAAVFFDMGHVDVWGKEHSWAQDPSLMNAPIYGTDSSEIRQLAFSLHHLFYLSDSPILALAEKPNLSRFTPALEAAESDAEGDGDSCTPFVQPALQ